MLLSLSIFICACLYIAFMMVKSRIQGISYIFPWNVQLLEGA
jgi:drug/metabolite transporter (DMT)-like permease